MRYLRSPFFALEYMDGGTLEKNLSGTPMPARYAAELVEMLASAIQTAHEQGAPKQRGAGDG